jgi:type III secretion system export apparatus protein
MTEISYVSNKAIWLILVLSAWPVIVATMVGLIVAVIQTVTQIQEQTLSFGIKLIAVSVCLFQLSGWMSQVIMNYANELFTLIGQR